MVRAHPAEICAVMASAAGLKAMTPRMEKTHRDRWPGGDQVEGAEFKLEQRKIFTLKALLRSSTFVSQLAPGKGLVAESESPLFGIAPLRTRTHNTRLRSRFSQPSVNLEPRMERPGEVAPSRAC